MNETEHPNQNSFSLGGLLFLTHFMAGATAVTLWPALAELSPLARPAFALAAAGLVGLGLTLPLQRAVRALDWALLQLLTSLPAPPMRDGGVLGGLTAKLNLLADRERPLAAQRQAQLQQAEEAAAQQERNRLARDLHDSIKQQLFSIQISAAAAEARLAADPDGALTALADVRGSGKAAMVEMNAQLNQLAPAPLEKIGLEQALREQAEALGYRSGAVVDVQIDPLLAADLIPTGGEEAIFRITQEALSNCARHARATAVSLHLTASAEAIQLTIQDDGQGFDPIAPRGGMGLDNMTRRAELVGGALTINSRKGDGSTIQAVIPLDRSAELKEQLMYKPTQTLNKLGLMGIGGGLALTAVLVYPLFVVLPGQFIPGWTAGSALLAWLLVAIALLAVAAVGYGAAKKLGVASRAGGAGVGATAGGIAALVFYAMLGSAAAALMGARHLLARGFAPAENEMEFLYWLTDAVNGTIWWVFGSFFVVLLIGAALGGAGGAIAPRTQDRDKRPDWRALNGLFSAVAVGGLLSAVFALVLTVSVFVLLGQTLVENAIELEAAGYTLHLPAAGAQFWQLATPMLIYLLLAAAFLGALLAGTGRWVTARADQREYAISAYVGGFTMMFLPIITANIILSAIDLRGLVMGWTAVNLALTAAALWLGRRLLVRFSGETGGLRLAADGALMATAVVVAILSVVSLYSAALWLWLAGVLFFAVVHSRDFGLPQEEQRPFAEQLSRGMSVLIPSILAFILPIIPFMAAAIALALPIVPSVKFLLVDSTFSTAEANTAVVEQIQELYRLNWLILFFPLVFSLALIGLFFAIVKVADRIKR